VTGTQVIEPPQSVTRLETVEPRSSPGAWCFAVSA
jgi:hypothetical protein